MFAQARRLLLPVSCRARRAVPVPTARKARRSARNATLATTQAASTPPPAPSAARFESPLPAAFQVISDAGFVLVESGLAGLPGLQSRQHRQLDWLDSLHGVHAWSLHGEQRPVRVPRLPEGLHGRFPGTWSRVRSPVSSLCFGAAHRASCGATPASLAPMLRPQSARSACNARPEPTARAPPRPRNACPAL